MNHSCRRPQKSSIPQQARRAGRAGSWSRAASGITLLEILVVISVIVLLAGLTGGFGFSTGGRPRDAMQLAVDVINVARADALASGSLRIASSPAEFEGMKTGVGICVDTTAKEKNLRYVVSVRWEGEDTNDNGILDEGEDKNGNGLIDEGWKFADRGRMLPMGTIFYADYSTAKVAKNTIYLNLDKQGELQDGTAGTEFIFLAFDPSGQPPPSSTMQWTFVKAVTDDAGTAAPVITDENDRDGFIVRQTGRIAIFDAPEDISKP